MYICHDAISSRYNASYAVMLSMSCHLVPDPIELDQPEFESYFAVKAIEKKVKEKTEEELAAEEEKVN